MQAQIRSLERQLACQLAQVKLEPLVEDFVDRWMDANELGQPCPDMLELVQAAANRKSPSSPSTSSTSTSDAASAKTKSPTKPASLKPSSTASPKSAAATTAKPASAPPANSSAATPTTCATSANPPPKETSA